MQEFRLDPDGTYVPGASLDPPMTIKIEFLNIFVRFESPKNFWKWFQVNIWSNNTYPPLTLVLSSYEPANYVVTVPDDVTIAHVFQVSFTQNNISVF